MSTTITLTAAMLAQVAAIANACDQHKGSTILTGVQLVADPDVGVTWCATDGRILAYVDHYGAEDAAQYIRGDRVSTILPQAFVQALKSFRKSKSISLTISGDPGSCTWSLTDGTQTTQGAVISGTYPDWQGIMGTIRHDADSHHPDCPQTMLGVSAAYMGKVAKIWGDGQLRWSFAPGGKTLIAPIVQYPDSIHGLLMPVNLPK